MHSCGAKTSEVPRLDLIPYAALVSLARRYEKGIVRYGRDNWRKGLSDRDYVLERAAHVLNHTAILIEKLQGLRPDDGDDDAGAILWGGAFLVEAVNARKREADAAMADVARIDALAALRESCEVAIWFNAAGGWSIEWHDGVDKIYAAATLREALDLALEGRKVQ